LGGIGYSGIGYKTSGVKAIGLGKDAGKLSEPTYENALNGSYPLARFLYIYVNKAPDKPMDNLTKEFVRFILSKEGQQIVVKDGYYPLPANLAQQMTAQLQ
jgi:phosphate transport system substrate-binding protein